MAHLPEPAAILWVSCGPLHGLAVRAADDGRLFRTARTARGGLIQDSAYNKVWHAARGITVAAAGGVRLPGDQIR